jgi:hypothetical protein
MFITMLFTVFKLWNQSMYPITDEWIQKLWHMYHQKKKKKGRGTIWEEEGDQLKVGQERVMRD